MRQFALHLGLLAGLATLPASAQAPYAIRVGAVTATEQCQYFREYEGEAAAVATPWIAAFASSWRSWIVKDCEQQFRTMRQSLESALAATGKFAVGSRGQTVELALSGVSEGGDADPVRPVGQGRDYGVSQAWMAVAADVTIRDERGQAIFGGPLLKKVRTGMTLSADGTYAASSNQGEAAYGQLQQEVALAVARMVAFRAEPLRVTALEDSLVQLNYGAPLLKLGTIIQVKSKGLRPLRYRVTSSDTRSAVAEMDGDNDPSLVAVGAEATVIESDDPAANGRRYQRARLP